MSGEKTEYVATCLFGLEKMLGEEITSLGYTREETIDGRVTFFGDIAAAARCNIRLRTAERLFIKVGDFEAPTFDALYEGVRALPWEEKIAKNCAFPVSGHSIKSKLFSIPDCQSIVKKAIVDRLRDKYGIYRFPEDGAKVKIEFFLLDDRATLMIDTSGTGLHKRGYRPEAGEAPLRETLACAAVLTSRPRENVLLWDPFCGSGTIAIEAACLMSGRYPAAQRRFAGEELPFLPAEIWKEAREEARTEVRPTDFEAFASDVDPKMVELARFTAKRAGVDPYIRFFQADARKIEKPDRRGTIVCNPPYGERMMTREEVAKLYREIGKVFRSFAPWQVYILSAAEDFEMLYGQKADKAKKVFNGKIRCRLYEYFKTSVPSFNENTILGVGKK